MGARRAGLVVAGLVLTAGLGARPADGGPAAQEPDREGLEFFETRVRPLLEERCTRCHGVEKQKSGLRLDARAALLEGGDRGPAIVPGDPEKSLLVEAIGYGDEDLAMPPKGKLPQAEIDDLVRWIELGAPAPDEAVEEVAAEAFDLAGRRDAHWAWRTLGEAAPPEVADEAWPLDSFDAFVLARLEAADLAPAPDAERAAWLRRATFDLIGLPPTPRELEAFLTDDRPDAFERVVDRLLASPRFGERWARHWLDLVRYGESRGHEYDFEIPNAWQYRDWLIRAFDRDLPYDWLVTEHLAGDLLDPPRRDPETGADESVLGTGFWYLGEEVHSPVDIRGDETDRTANKIDVFGKAFLGLTVACARCHDHKFDAISQADYYALSGYLVSSSYRQVRFESRGHNAALASQLRGLEQESLPAIARAVAVELERDVERVDELLLAAREVLAGGLEVQAGPVGDGVVEASLPESADLLFEDFERDTWGPWRASGAAFGEGPVLRSTFPEHMGEIGGRGERVVNTYFSRAPDGATRQSDGPIGTLESPPFPIVRDHVHFLLGGGEHEGEVGVELVVDGQVSRSLTGHQTNHLKPESFDVSELRGRTAFLRLVDRHTGSWGQLGFDHVVFSNRPGPEALDQHLAPTLLARRLERVRQVALARDVSRELLTDWVEALERAWITPDHPLHLFARAACSAGPFEREYAAALEDARRRDRELDEQRTGALVHVDHGAGAPLIQDGAAFTSARAGQPRLSNDPDDPDHPLAGVSTLAAAVSDPTWDVLELAPGCEREDVEPSYVSAGRLLRTPTFELDSGHLRYLLRGAGHVYASVDLHRVISGPLHLALVFSFDTGGEWAWVEQDLADYAGHRLHVEFTPLTGGGGMELARVVESERLGRGSPVFRSLYDERLEGARSAEELAARMVEIAGDGVRRFAAGSADPAPDSDRRLVDWLLQRSRQMHRSAEVRAVALPYLGRRGALVERIQRTSHTAPAMLDGSGVDEYLLVRGSSRTPGELVPRRSLEALSGRAQPSPERGSGRLELARRLTDPATNPFLPRVLVNRLWHHLFGRGIVASVDDFGVMGELPTHPELLDHLALRFVDGGWSIKTMLRALVLSRTYRQSSVADARAEELDPKNLLLHHAPVRRLQAEALRDSILAVSGSLVHQLGGPPVPLHLTEFLTGRGRPETNGPLDGAGRRSLYIAVRRNFPQPFFQVFDFPTPFSCMGRRGTSNVPAQALTLMNDPFVVQQAGRWAERLLAEPARNEGHRIERAFLEAFARAPDAAERRAALSFLDDQAAEHDGDRARAWGDLCHVLFNLKEFAFLH